MLFILLFFATLLVAYFNGANDNFKGVATLYGSGITGYRTTLLWGTSATFLGSVSSLFFAHALLVRFSGQGLVSDAILDTPEFMTAVGLGAGLTVLIATFMGFPVSTTHSLTGALAGAGVVAVGLQLNLTALVGLFFMPLLASPVLAISLGSASSWLTKSKEPKKALQEDSCLCMGKPVHAMSIENGMNGMNAVELHQEGTLLLMTGTMKECKSYFGNQKLVSVQKKRIRDVLHFLSGGLVSFARGLNDTPKIVGLLLVANAFNIRYGMLAVAGAMAAGGLLHARKIASVMSHKISGMNENEGITANLITSFLVIGASRLGLPVSTTHVSAGSIFGTGLVSGKADKTVFSRVFAAWVITLPVSALIAAIIYFGII